MGIRYQKRINLGKGVGLNVSKSGVSPSIKTKYGSVGPKGFSIRTGIPGLSYKGGKNSDAGKIMFVLALLGAGISFLRWLATKIYHFILRKKIATQHKRPRNDN